MPVASPSSSGAVKAAFSVDYGNVIDQLPLAPVDASIPAPTPFGEAYERSASHEKGCSAFVAKTYGMVSDESLRDLIRWESAGTSFVVLQPDKLAPTLALHFKHRKFSSFVRQLNMYNFKKVGNPRQWEFYHDAFRRGRTHLLRYIKRKKSTPSNKSKVAAGLKTEVMGLKNERDTLQHDIDLLTDQQCDMEVQLAQIMDENGQLRQDLAVSTFAHETMRRCVDQIMSFVTTTFPEHDLSELANLLAACPTPAPIGSVRPREDDDTADEPARKRRKLSADCCESDDDHLLPLVKTEPVCRAPSQLLPWDSPKFNNGEGLDMLSMVDVDTDDLVPGSRAPTMQSMNDFLDHVLHQ
jgi:hypothetical protein